MSEPTDSREIGVKRRDVLKRGAVATGAAMVGGTAMVGNAAAQGACNVRIKGVDDCGGKDNENALKQGGRKATAYVTNCGALETDHKTFEVIEEVDGAGLCPEPNGNPKVRCYDVKFCPGGAIREVCVKGTLPKGSFWQVTEAEECQ